MSTHPQPTEIKLLQNERRLIICFDDDNRFELTCDDLRKNSPSAEKPPETIENVNIISIEPIGNYAIKLGFDDGHNTGIYSWEFLYKLGKEAK